MKSLFKWYNIKFGPPALSLNLGWEGRSQNQVSHTLLGVTLSVSPRSRVRGGLVCGVCGFGLFGGVASRVRLRDARA